MRWLVSFSPLFQSHFLNWWVLPSIHPSNVSILVDNGRYFYPTVWDVCDQPQLAETYVQQHQPIVFVWKQWLGSAAAWVSAYVCREIKKLIYIQRMPPTADSHHLFVREWKNQTMAGRFRSSSLGCCAIILKNKSRSLRLESNINNNHRSSINLTVRSRNAIKCFCLAKRSRAEKKRRSGLHVLKNPYLWRSISHVLSKWHENIPNWAKSQLNCECVTSFYKRAQALAINTQPLVLSLHFRFPSIPPRVFLTCLLFSGVWINLCCDWLWISNEQIWMCHCCAFWIFDSLFVPRRPTAAPPTHMTWAKLACISMTEPWNISPDLSVSAEEK